jgi:hypothetical protein
MEKAKYTSPIISGIIIMAFFISLTFIPFFKSDGGRLIQGTLSILLRVIACVWISHITKRQHRKSLGYIILGIFIPAITLIILGLIRDKKEVSIR